MVFFSNHFIALNFYMTRLRSGNRNYRILTPVVFTLKLASQNNPPSQFISAIRLHIKLQRDKKSLHQRID